MFQVTNYLPYYIQSLDELTDKAVPKNIKLHGLLDIEEPVGKFP